MKQRVTYVVKDPDAFSPDQLVVNKKGAQPSFTLKDVHATKEQRITIGLDELPNELRTLFQQWHEFHTRWVSPKGYTAIPPFTSRMSPGLHVFFTPLESTPDSALCNQLQLLDPRESKCSSANETAIKLPILSGRFSMSASSQYYTYLDSLESFRSNLLSKYFPEQLVHIAKYHKEEQSLAYVDIDYDAISRAVILTAVWPEAPEDQGWSETISLQHPDSTIEIGVLSHEANADPEDIQFGGFLTVLGQDDAPKATRFQTSTRHYPMLSTSDSPTAPPKPHLLNYTTSFSQPTGLHPTLTLSFPKQYLTPPNPSCKLHTHLTLPSFLFIDKYQFTDTLFLQSKNLKSLRSLAGATDLEAPDWVVKQWGSAALFELAHPRSPSATSPLETWNISIPLHLRYLPAASASHASVPVPWPVVFWACRADEGAKMAANPFDRTHLGYEALFGPKTRFMHIEPGFAAGRNKSLVEWIDVPVLDTRGTKWVERGTVGVVVLSFLGLCWLLFGRVVGKTLDGEKKTKMKKKQ